MWAKRMVGGVAVAASPIFVGAKIRSDVMPRMRIDEGKAE
jgi:hypothetical protein